MLIYNVTLGEYHKIPKDFRLRIPGHSLITINTDTYDVFDDYFYPEFNDDDLDLVDHYKELFNL